MIISRKRFEEEVNKRVEEATYKAQERMWEEQRQRNMNLDMANLEARLIAVEKKVGIDHPSHHDNVVRCY